MRGARGGFLLAKLYGTVARSYVGANFRDLLRLKSLAELQQLLWPGKEGEAVAAPSSPRAQEMEARIAREGVDAMRRVLQFLGKPVPILVHILRKLEFQNLKIVLRGLETGKVDTSRLQDLGEYAALRLEGVTDFERAVRVSPYSWTLKEMGKVNRARLENKIDGAYFVELVRLARALPARDRAGVLRYVMLQVSLADVIWALRLRFTFRMDEALAKFLLVPGLGETHRKAVARVFEIPPDAQDEWRKWRFGWLLGDQLGESFRGPDPVRAEAKASQRLYTRAHQLLHQHPFTLCPLVAYFSLKQQEVALLRTAVEATALGVPEKDVLAMVGER